MELFYRIPGKVTMRWDWCYCKKVDSARKFETIIPKQILTSESMFEFCIKRIKGINFIYRKETDLKLQHEEQLERYNGVTTLPET